jgi:hypothetical protein
MQSKNSWIAALPKNRIFCHGSTGSRQYRQYRQQAVQAAGRLLLNVRALFVKLHLRP